MSRRIHGRRTPRVASFLRSKKGEEQAGAFAQRYDRMRDQPWQWRSPAVDEDTLVPAGDRDQIARRCMDLRRHNPIAAGLVERLADYVVGPDGLTPQAQTSDPAWNDAAEWYFYEWSKVADYRQRAHFQELQRQLVVSRMLMGDMGWHLLANGQIQPVEGLRIGTPEKRRSDSRIKEGVELTPAGIPRRYWIAPRDKTGHADFRNAEPVQAANFILAAHTTRIDQVRGWPELAPILNHLADFESLNESLVKLAQAQARIAYAAKRKGGASAMRRMGPRNATPSGQQQREERLPDGTILYIDIDEEMVKMDGPSASMMHDPSARLMLQVMASALSLPYEFLLMLFNSSFSASRAALMSTYHTIAMWQSWLQKRALNRTWNWKIGLAIRNGELPPAPVDSRGVSEWYKVQWAPPEMDWIDPLKQEQARQAAWRLSTGSITRFAREQGKDAQEVLGEKVADIATAHRLAAEANAANPGLALTWKDVIDAGVPGAQTAGKETEAGSTEDE